MKISARRCQRSIQVKSEKDGAGSDNEIRRSSVFWIASQQSGGACAPVLAELVHEQFFIHMKNICDHTPQ
jgi:hypothetical protein